MLARQTRETRENGGRVRGVFTEFALGAQGRWDTQAVSRSVPTIITFPKNNAFIKKTTT
jgi:hypothetical protein